MTYVITFILLSIVIYARRDWKERRAVDRRIKAFLKASIDKA
jgi:hypothetical protein